MFYIYTDTEKNTDIYNFFNKVTAYSIAYHTQRWNFYMCG